MATSVKVSAPRCHQHPTELFSLVVPVHDEQDVLEAFHKRLSAVLEALPFASEVEGSTDASA